MTKEEKIQHYMKMLESQQKEIKEAILEQMAKDNKFGDIHKFW